MYQTTLQHFEKKLKQRFPEENFTVLVFSQTNAPVTIRCNNCNHVYNYKQGTTLYASKRKYFCKLCNTASVKSMIQACNEHNLTIIKYGEKVTDYFTLQCNNCGTLFERTPMTWIKMDCPVCGVNKKILDKSFYQEQLNKTFGNNELVIIDEIPKSHKMTVRHKCGFTRTTSFKAILSNRVCPVCEKTISLGEKKILLYLEKNQIDFIYQYPIAGTKMHFDFFLEAYNLAIEFNGIQHYEPIDFFGGEERFKKQQLYDENKRQYCKNNNIHLLIINYDQINAIEAILAAELDGGGGYR